MAQNQIASGNAMELDRLAAQLAKDPHSKVFMPLAEEYGKAGMWQEAATVLENGLKLYPGFITAMVALGRAYDQLGQQTKAKAILEESVKLSPENLRAHRTLIKIYQSQGLNQAALQSCAVILAANPRDQEVRTIQSTLGGPLNQQKEAVRPKPPTPTTQHLSTQQAPIPPVSDTLIASGKEVSAVPSLVDSTPVEPEAPSTTPSIGAEEPLPMAEFDLQAVDGIGTPPPSPHADVVAQLEAWLHAIKTRRRDGQLDDDSPPKIS